MLNQGLTEANGLPASTPNETSELTDPSVEIYRQFYGYMEKQATLDAVLEQHDLQGIGMEFDQIVMQPYQERNKEPLLQERPGMTDAERIEMMKQLEPVTVDPNWIADMRQRLVKIDIDMKAVDPSFSVYTNPKTKRVANWMAREAGPFTPGYLVSGDQQAEDQGFIGNRALETAAFAEGATGFGLSILGGIADLGAKAVKAIAGEAYGLPWAVATNFTEDENGNLVNNGGKVPGFVQTIAAVNARMLDQNVRDYVHRVDKAREFENLTANGFEKVMRGASGVVGMGLGFGLPAGAAMGAGKAAMVGGQIAGKEFAGLMTGGLHRMAAGGASSRMVALSRVMAGTAGAGVGNGLAEGVAFGKADGYGEAFVHGMAMAPVLMSLGALGRKSESVLNRPHIPKFVARSVSGALEGVGFGALEHAQTGALWKLLQDPTNETWEIYAKNMLGFAVFKGAFGRSVANAPGFGEAAGRQITRQAGREKLAEEVSRADDSELMRASDEAIQEEMGRERAMREQEAAESESGAEPPLQEGLGTSERDREIREQQEQDRSDAERDKAIKRRRAERLTRGPESGVEKARKNLERRQRGIEVFEARPSKQQKPDTRQRLQRKLAEAEQELQRAESDEQRLDDEMPDLEQQAEVVDVNPTEPSQVTSPRLSAKELATEIQRIRAEGPTPENRKRVIDLLEGQRGKVAEGAADLLEGQRTEINKALPEGTTMPGAEMRTRKLGKPPVASDLEARVIASGVPRETLQELGDISRGRRAARSPAEAAALWRRQLEVEQELDALEMSQDPVMNAKMREALREREVEELDAIEGELEAVDPTFGERHGPESMRSDANPARQQENLLREGEKPVSESEIMDVLQGRPGFPGVRIFGKRLGAIAGSAVQIAIRSGQMGKSSAAGVFKIYENLTRTKKGMDLVVALHEWSHAMQRQVMVGQGGPKFSKAVRKWLQAQPDPVLQDMAKILRNYPGADKLPLWVVGAEAWAEWHARNLLGDATLRAEVPDLTRVMEAWLAQQPALIPQYQEITDLVDIYKRQGALERVNKSVQRGQRRKQGSVAERIIGRGEEVWDRVVKSFFDDMHLLKKSQRRWLEVSDMNVDDLSILDNPARVYDAVAMTASKQADSFIRRGTHNLALERTGESLEAVMNDVGKGLKGKERNDKTIDFINYLVSTRALDLIGHGKEQTQPKSDYLSAIKELIGKNPEFAGLSERVKRWSDALLDLVGEAGGVPAVEIQRMKDYSTVYIPFVRVMQGAVAKRGPRGAVEGGKPMKKMVGDSREISDPMEAMFDTTTMMIAKGHQQMVTKALYKMSLRADVGGLASVIPRKNVAESYRLDQVFRNMRDKVMKRLDQEGLEGEDMAGWDEAFGMFGEMIKDFGIGDELVTMFGQKLMPFGEGANIIAYTPRLSSKEIESLPKHRQRQARVENGKMQWLEVDPNAYTALMGLDQPMGPTFMDNAIMKVVFGYPKKAVRFFATDANPVFVAANAIRDIMSAPVFDREGQFKPFSGFRKFFEGMAMMVNPDATPGRRITVDMFEASGARTASIYVEGVRREMRGEVVGTLGKTREAVLKATGWWTNKTAGPESFIRVQEFDRVHKAAMGAGKSKLEAVMEALEAAKEITVNFARAGTIARAYNQMTPYFSASFAGQRKMLRSITGMEGTTDQERSQLQSAAIANGLVGITAPSMAIWALVQDEDWYRDLPEWRKRHFINFKVPGTDTITSLPLPFELGTLFGTMPQILGDHITGANPVDFWPTFAESMFPYLRGVGSLLPAGAKPALEAASGYNFFTQSEQTPFWVERNNPPGEQMRPGTSKMAQEAFYLFEKFRPDFISFGIDNPIELEQALGGYTAGASTTFFRHVDELAGLKDHPGIQPGMGLLYGGFTNRFARQTPHGSSRAVDEFYNKLAPAVEQRARGKNRTPIDKRALRDINRDRDRMADIRRQIKSGEITRAEGDRMIYEIAVKAIDRN